MKRMIILWLISFVVALPLFFGSTSVIVIVVLTMLCTLATFNTVFYLVAKSLQ